MELISPEFENGEFMPEKYGSTRKDVNPPLKIRDVPEDAESLALIFDDPDALKAAGKIWEHWTLWNISPETEEIEEDSDIGIEGMTDFRKKGYGGPNPPDGVHTLRFMLYAIDKELDIPENSRKEDVKEAIQGHILAEAQLETKFDRL